MAMSRFTSIAHHRRLHKLKGSFMSIKVSSWIWDHSPQKGAELLMLLALADNANEQGVCWPGIDNLTHKARYKSTRAARYCISRLERAGEIAVVSRRGKSNEYVFTAYREANGMSRLPDGMEAREPAKKRKQKAKNKPTTPALVSAPPSENGEKSTPALASAPPPLQQLVHPTPALASAPRTVIEPPVEPSIKKKDSAAAGGAPPLEPKPLYDRPLRMQTHHEALVEAIAGLFGLSYESSTKTEMGVVNGTAKQLRAVKCPVALVAALYQECKDRRWTTFTPMALTKVYSDVVNAKQAAEYSEPDSSEQLTMEHLRVVAQEAGGLQQLEDFVENLGKSPALDTKGAA